MRIAYFDCFSGASGDMILGALVDAGLDLRALRGQLETLPVSEFSLSARREARHGIWGTRVEVLIGEPPRHRHLSDVLKVIRESGISDRAKERASRIFVRLAEAEAKVHGTSPEEVHFHEVGALDAIVDVVGAVVGLELLGVDEVWASPLRLGTGYVESAHGRLPIPSPATVELTRGVPVVRTGVPHELLTPTGAAILTTLASGLGKSLAFRAEYIGYGVGAGDFPELPNLLRVQIGKKEGDWKEDRTALVETNIDDMIPELYGHLMERLFAEGALDVYFTPVVMKKGRPGVLVSVLVPPERVGSIAEVLFRETTTLGLRVSYADRLKLHRREGTVRTPWGPVRVKVSQWGGKEWPSPEYEDCARIAREHNVPLREVYRVVQRIAMEAYYGGNR